MPDRDDLDRILNEAIENGNMGTLLSALKNNTIERIWNALYPDISWSGEVNRKLAERNRQTPIPVQTPMQGSDQEQEKYFPPYIDRLAGKGGPSINTSVREVMKRIDLLMEQRRNENKNLVSGLIAGRVQSGKTGTYCGLMLHAFERYEYNLQIVFTSGKNDLEQQTHSRIQDAIDEAISNDLRIDRSFPTPKKLNWIVVQKNSSERHLGSIQTIINRLADGES